MRAVYQGIRKIMSKYAPQVKSMKDKHGKILTQPEAVNTRWNEYFDKLYNDPNEVDEAVLVGLPSSRNTKEIPGIEEDEVVAAITRMKNGKAPGIDNVTVAELRAATKGEGLKVIHRLFKGSGKQRKCQKNVSGQLLCLFTRNKTNLTGQTTQASVCYDILVKSSHQLCYNESDKELKKFSRRHKQDLDPEGAQSTRFSH